MRLHKKFRTAIVLAITIVTNLVAQEQPVHAAMKIVESDRRSEWWVELTLSIAPDWHIYGMGPQKNPQQHPLSLSVEPLGGVELVGSWTADGAALGGVIQGIQTFRHRIKLDSPKPPSIRVRIEYQACTSSLCMAPQVVELDAPIANKWDGDTGGAYVERSTGPMEPSLLSGPNTPSPLVNTPQWHEEPFRLKAGDEPIDTFVFDVGGHAAPFLADLDGDGNRDLVVGTLQGKFRFFRNLGTDSEAQFGGESTWLMAGLNGDEPAQIPNFCCVAAGPQLVDIDDRNGNW